AAEKADAKAGSLEKKTQKLRRKSPQAPASTRKFKHVPAHKRFVAKPPAVAPKPGAAKPRPRPIFRVKRAGKPVQPAALGSEANIQVPRELTLPPAEDESESNVPAPPS